MFTTNQITMKKNNLFTAVALFACLIFSVQVMAQEERAEEKSDTKVIIIEEKVDKYGNKTVTKTVKEGNFTDEEIEKMIEGKEKSEKHKKDMMFFGDDGEKKGYLGVQIRDTENGVEVTEVVEGSAAADASLKAGDIVTSINGTAVESMEELVNMITGMEPGAEVEIAYTREGDAQTTTARLGERANVFSFERMDGEWEEHGEEMHKEMEKMHKEMEKMHGKMDKMHKEEHKLHERHMEGMNEAPRPRFGVYIDEAEGGGVLVNEVIKGSLAEDAGLNEGDIITSFNGVEVNTPEELIAAVKAAGKGQKIAVKYQRDGKAEKATVKFE